MTFWSSERLRKSLRGVVQPTDAKAFVEYGSVVLHIGEEVYVTPHDGIKDPGSHTKAQLKPTEPFTIPAGQFAFLLTEETITIPFDAIGFISIKAKTKFRGLVNVSGFHVDPGYSGRLIFSVFNAGPAQIQLQQGMPLFLLWLADFDGNASAEDARIGKENYQSIPVDLINNIPGELYSLQGLSTQIRDLSQEIKVLKERFLTWTTIAGLILAFLLRGPIWQGLQSIGANGSGPTSNMSVTNTPGQPKASLSQQNDSPAALPAQSQTQQPQSPLKTPSDKQ